MNKGWLVRIDFLDFCDSSSENVGLVPCTVWGVVIFENEIEITLAKWVAHSDVRNSNSEFWNILKHDVFNVEKIREESLANSIEYEAPAI